MSDFARTCGEIHFEGELKDLEIEYKRKLVHFHKKNEELLPSMLYYMEKFLDIHKQTGEIREKLNSLLEKTGRGSSCEDSEGGDDNE